MHLAESQAMIGQQLGDAMALARTGQLDAAEASLRQILIAVPDHHDALQLLGMVARSRGDHDAAVALFDRSLAIRPDQPHVLNNFGNSLTDSGRYADAVQAYERALALKPGYADARMNLALARLALGQAWRSRCGSPAAPARPCRSFANAPPARPARRKSIITSATVCRIWGGSTQPPKPIAVQSG